MLVLFFFFNDTATTEIYTLSLHDALPICPDQDIEGEVLDEIVGDAQVARLLLQLIRRTPCQDYHRALRRSEEHTSELQSLAYLVCRLLLEKKKYNQDGLRCAITRFRIHVG